MTRARTTHTWAVGRIIPLIQPLLEAVLCAFVSLMHSVAATLGMRFKLCLRDWHTDADNEALPQAKPDIQLKETRPNPEPILRGDRRYASIPQDEASGHAQSFRSPHPEEAEGRLEGFVAVREADELVQWTNSSGEVRFARGGLTSLSSAHPDERRDPGQASNLVPPCSFKSAHASKPFLDADIRRHERLMLRIFSLI